MNKQHNAGLKGLRIGNEHVLCKLAKNVQLSKRILNLPCPNTAPPINCQKLKYQVNGGLQQQKKREHHVTMTSKRSRYLYSITKLIYSNHSEMKPNCMSTVKCICTCRGPPLYTKYLYNSVTLAYTETLVQYLQF